MMTGRSSLRSWGASGALPAAAHGNNAAPHIRWIFGAMNYSKPPGHGTPSGTALSTTGAVCGTTNGCTDGDLFLACADPNDTIAQIDFAAFGNVSQCPSPAAGACVASPAAVRQLVEAACLGLSNCSVPAAAVPAASRPACLATMPNLLLMATATCARGGVRANQLRLEFTLPVGALPRSALGNVSALGHHVLWCNGALVLPGVALEPGRPGARRVFSSRVDLLPHLRAGQRNVLAASLGNGWVSSDGDQPGARQGPPMLWLDAQIVLEGDRAAVGAAVHDAANGGAERAVTTLRIGTNGGWRSSVGEVQYNSVYMGERRDMRMATPGWTSPGFDDDGWLPVGVADSGSDAVQPDGPAGRTVTPRTRPPVRELMHLRPVRVVERWRGTGRARRSQSSSSDTREASSGSDSGSSSSGGGGLAKSNRLGLRIDGDTLLLDFGVNMAGVVVLPVPPSARDGDILVVRHCEVLGHAPLLQPGAAAGRCFYGELVNAEAMDSYTLSADPARNGDSLQPAFTVHGFRYAQITAIPVALAGNSSMLSRPGDSSTGSWDDAGGSELGDWLLSAATAAAVEAVVLGAVGPASGVLRFPGTPLLEQVRLRDCVCPWLCLSVWLGRCRSVLNVLA